MIGINKRVYGYASNIVALGNEMKHYMVKQTLVSEAEKLRLFQIGIVLIKLQMILLFLTRNFKS